MNKDIALSLSRSYVSDWGVVQAAREFIQNTLDQNGTVTSGTNWIKMDTFDGMIEHKHLLLGSGTKSKNSKVIGGHCEGFKLAFLVMAREELPITFINGNEMWVPYFKYNKDFQEDCLHISVVPYPEGDEQVVSIYLSSLTECDIETVVGNTLSLQDQGYSRHETTLGEILLEPQHKGKVYCGGLFADYIPSLTDGFNINPEHVKLDRDRSCLRAFDVKWISKEMWAQVAVDPTEDVANYIASGLDSNNGGLEYLSNAYSNVSEKVTDAVFDIYEEKYKGKILVDSHEEKSKLQATGNSNVDYLGNNKDSFVQVLKKSKKYQEIVLNTKLEKPEDLLETYKDTWYDYFGSTEMLHAYDDMAVKLNKLL